MINVLFLESRGLYSHWSKMMLSAVLGQWRVLDTQYQASLDFLKTLADAKEVEAPAEPAPTARPGLSDLESKALERVRKGFPPPPEVYLAQNRNRIDWSRFPEWAWPTDPELFTGTSHEG